MVPEGAAESNSPSTTAKKRKCSVHDVFRKNKGRVEPAFVEFANGRPLDSKALTTTLYQNTSEDVRRQRRRILSVETEHLQYAGANFGSDAFLNNSTDTFLGILDKNTGKMVVVEASSYFVRPLLGSQFKQLKSKVEIHSQSYMEKQEAVAEAFGSKKARLAVSRRKQFKVDAETMSGAINQAVTNTEMDEELVEGGWSDKRIEALMSILPPSNREASKVEDVYNLEDIAPDYFLAYLQGSAEDFFQTRYPDSSYSLLVIELLSVAKGEKEELLRLRLCCLGLYIHHLLCFLRLKGYELNNSNILEDCPPEIRKHILRNYTEGKHKRMRTNEAEDQVICLVLVLAFIVNKFQLDLKVVLQSVPVTRDKLLLMMKLIGATYQSTTQDFVLKLPLTQPSQHLPVIGRGSKRIKRKV